MTKEEVYEIIASASVKHNNLGLFVGAGFSKAVFEKGDVVGSSPLSWIDLLQKLCDKNDIDWKAKQDKDYKYKSCPEIASAICKDIMESKSCSFEEASLEIKKQICGITSWYPNKEQREIIAPHLNKLNPQWFITTNYDLVIECLLPDRVEALSPDDIFSSYLGLIPVFHMHGIRTKPESLVITNEDYIRLFRPNEYRLQRLPFLLMESVTVLLGYGIGDQNVLTALDWTKNVYQKDSKPFNNKIIQLAYSETPKPDAYECDGLIILETKDLLKTIEEICSEIDNALSKKENMEKQVKTFIDTCLNLGDDKIKCFIENPSTRNNFVSSVNNAADYITNGACIFLSRVFDACWKRTEPDGAFNEYEYLVDILVYCFTKISYENTKPALFELLASQFRSLAYYIYIPESGDCRGKSIVANKRWDKEKTNIPADYLEALRVYAKENDSYSKSMSRVLDF